FGWLGLGWLGAWRHLAWGVDVGLVAGLWLRGASRGLLIELGAVVVLLAAACGLWSSAAAAVVLFPVVVLAHGRTR
ncbi:MAG: hypothetical protein ABMA64_38245, partial [Myxococcota bacterium]